MTEALLLPAPDAPIVRGAASPLAWIASLLRAWRRETTVPAELQTAIDAVGSVIIASGSLDELELRLDGAAFDPMLYRAIAEFARYREAAGSELTNNTASLDERTKDVLGLQATRILEETLPLALAAADVAPPVEVEFDPDRLAASLPQLLYDPDVPSFVGFAILAGLRTSAASLALGYAYRRETRLEPWLAVAIAERFRNDLRSYLPFLYGFPGAPAPPEGIEPLDLVQLQAAHDDARRRLEASADDADVSGQDVYVPANGK